MAKYQCHMAACCTYHQPTIIPKRLALNKNIEEFSGKKNIRRMDQ